MPTNPNKLKREYEQTQREWERAIDALESAEASEKEAKAKFSDARRKYLATKPAEAKTVATINKLTLGKGRN